VNFKDKPMQKRGALGRGISSLLGDMADEGEGQDQQIARELEAEVVRLDINAVDPNPNQPRKIFDEAALKELAESLKLDGLLQPIVVARSEQEGRYVIVAGERRYRASKLAGFDSIPAIVKDGVADDMLRLALIENIQRADLNIIEEAEAYASLIKDYGLTQEQCADRVGKERSTVANALRLLSLPREIQDDIMDGRLTMGHGRAILSLDDKKLMLRCRDMVIKKGLSVRQTEALVKTFGHTKKPSADGGLIKDEADLQYITESLRGFLHTKVKLAGTTSRGRIEISYFSAAELERILGAMGHKF
jgi:ParB family chromosome partitioning protein